MERDLKLKGQCKCPSSETETEGEMVLKWNTTVAEAEDQAGERSQAMKGKQQMGLAHLRNTRAIKLAQHFHMSDGSSSNPLFKTTNYTGSGMGFLIKLSSLLNSELERIL